MTKQDIVTLIGVIAKVKEIAERDYNGMIYDNILAIFNKLATKEKRVLLKGLINICFVVEDKILVSTDDLLEVKDAITETKGKIEVISTVEENNKLELAKQLVRLKTIIVQAFILLLLVILIGLLVLAPANSGVTVIIASLSELFSALFK